MAGSPATEPITAETTGTLESRSTSICVQPLPVRQVGATDVLEALHAAAGGVEQAHIGQLPLPCALVRRQFVAEPATAAARAAAHGEVAGGKHHLAPSEASHPFDGAAWREGL